MTHEFNPEIPGDVIEKVSIAADKHGFYYSDVLYFSQRIYGPADQIDDDDIALGILIDSGLSPHELANIAIRFRRAAADAIDAAEKAHESLSDVASKHGRRVIQD